MLIGDVDALGRLLAVKRPTEDVTDPGRSVALIWVTGNDGPDELALAGVLVDVNL